ncbi:DNA translocase FtsK, partial [Chloroflexota bacterium]
SLFAPWTVTEAESQADSKLEEAIALIQGRDRISTSFVQRQMRIGFPRAARIMDQLEEQGIVGPDEGGGRGRKVLIGQGIDFDEIDERLPGVAPR